MKFLFLFFAFFLNGVYAENHFSEFGFSLYPHLEKENENLLFSPYSLAQSLSMIYLGANGKTKEELGLALSLPETIPESLLLNGEYPSANSIWIADGFSILKSYQELAALTLQAECKAISFHEPDRAALEINHWINDNTAGKIPRLCSASDFTKDTRLVLVNALSIKGNWLSPFYPELTKVRDFHSSEDKIIPIPMMQQKGHYLFYENESVKMAALECSEPKDLLFILLLPKHSTRDLWSYDFLLQALEKAEREPLDLILPKFTLRMRLDPKAALKKLGIVNLFTNSSDLSLIDGKGELFLDKIIHESYLSINERGLDAAAASASFLSTTSLCNYTSFHLDRPFLFAIFDRKAQSLLFIGEIHSPSEEL